MLYSNLIGLVGSVAMYTYSVIVHEDDTLSKIIEDPALLNKVILISVCGALGQIFIYLTISLHDCLMLSVFTTSRKCLSVVLSSIIFKHSFSNAQWLGASMVLGGTILEVYTKHQSKTKTHEAKKHEKVDKEK
jgi:UDP-galactose transporter B1